MNLFSLLAGALEVKQLTDYPKSITTLKNRLPKEERDAFIRDYKKLSSSDKTQFKEYLHDADLQAAGKMIGHDLAKVQESYIVKKSPSPSEAKSKTTAADVAAAPLGQLDFSARINQILQTSMPSTDSLLVAEAAKKYQALQLDGLPFAERHKKIMETYNKAQQELDAPHPAPPITQPLAAGDAVLDTVDSGIETKTDVTN